MTCIFTCYGSLCGRTWSSWREWSLGQMFAVGSVRSPNDSEGKESVRNAGDPASIPGSGRSPGEGHGNPLQYSCPENPMHREAWRDTVHGVTESQTQLKQLSTHIDHNTSFTLLYLTYHIDILFISHHHKKGEYSTIRHSETQRKRENTSQVLLQYIVIITPLYYPLLLLISEICLIYKLNFIIGRYIGFPSSSDGKESACNAGDLGLIPGSGRSPAEGTDNPLQYSCLENPMDREAWQVTVQEVTKSQTWLSDFYSSKEPFPKLFFPKPDAYFPSIAFSLKW